MTELGRANKLTVSFFLASGSAASVEAFLLTAVGFSLMLLCASKNAEISSGQSRFSSGSQVLSALSSNDEQKWGLQKQHKTINEFGHVYRFFENIIPYKGRT